MLNRYAMLVAAVCVLLPVGTAPYALAAVPGADPGPQPVASDDPGLAGTTKLNGGTLEAGYQIGCGIQLGVVKLVGQIGVSLTSSLANIIPTGVAFPISGMVQIHPKPGQTNQIRVDRKVFRAAPVRVSLRDVHIKIDGCVGQSFLRSYSTLTSSTTDTDDIVAHYGITKTL
jgi:MspA